MNTDPSGPNPYLFLVGSPRSGTTLLRRILDAHSQISISAESPWITEYWNSRTGLTPEGLLTEGLIPQLLAHPKFHHLGVGPQELRRLLPPGARPTYASFVAVIFDLAAKARGKPLIGDKTPNDVRQIHVLHALWPRARFVHLIRDGRDVCLSLLGWKRKAARMAELFPTWEEDSVTTAALKWERDVRRGQELGRRLESSLYYEIRYEDLVQPATDEVRKLCGFLNVPYEEGMLEFHRGHTRDEPGLSPKEAWLPITQGLRDWRTQMPSAEVERFEAVAGDLLDELGYRRACPSPPPAVRERATSLRERFVQELAARREAVR
jgi:hypothetical protein